MRNQQQHFIIDGFANPSTPSKKKTQETSIEELEVNYHKSRENYYNKNYASRFLGKRADSDTVNDSRPSDDATIEELTAYAKHVRANYYTK